MAFHANLRIQISIHIFTGRLLHPWFENLSLDFISFVSSNWFVINYKKGEIISAIKPYCGFWHWWPPNQRNNEIYRDDKQGIEKWGWCTGCRCPNYKRWLDLAQRRFKFFYVLKLSLGKAVLLRGILGQLVNCWTRCSNSQIYILSPSQNSQPNFISSYLFWLGRQCRPVQSSSAALSWPLDPRGIYTLQAQPTMVIHFTQSFCSKQNRTKAHPLSSIVAPPSLK